ncbi:MAG: hypothetical protein ACLSUM_06575 [Dysosmobacter welbionis]
MPRGPDQRDADEHELTAALPELVQKVVVVQTVSDELWEQAKRLLRDHHL